MSNLKTTALEVVNKKHALDGWCKELDKIKQWTPEDFKGPDDLVLTNHTGQQPEDLSIPKKARLNMMICLTRAYEVEIYAIEEWFDARGIEL